MLTGPFPGTFWRNAEDPRVTQKKQEVWSRRVSRGILRPMKTTRLFLLSACCIAALSCNRYEKSDSVPPSAPTPHPTASGSASPDHQDVAGGLALVEPGDTSPAKFEGTASIVEKKTPGLQPVVLKAVRTGKHESFDRVVFEFAGNVIPGYHVEYIDKPVRDCGAGEVVPLAGEGFLLVKLQPAQAHTEAGVATIQNRQQTPGLPIIKELKLICDFEADVQWVFGLSSPNRYRILELSNPARLVIDIAH